MIDSKEISVVVQGAIVGETKRCLESIRRHLPGAEIILSTWKGADVSDLDYDRLVLSDDPGGISKNSAYRPCNVNRQLVSTQAGLKVVKRKYVLKLRSDLIVKSTKFMKFFDMFPKRDARYTVFKHRVLISTIFSREQYMKYNFLFHPSDFWFFGLTSDVCDYWLNTPIHDGTVKQKKNLTIWAMRSTTNNWMTFVPEQYICINWVHRHFPDVVFEDYSDFNPDAVQANKNILYNNFTFVGPYQSGIWSKKHRKSYVREYSDIDIIKGLITHELFQQRYAELCDKDYVPHPDRYKYLYKMRRDFEYVCLPFKYAILYFIRIIRSLWYFILFVTTR